MANTIFEHPIQALWNRLAHEPVLPKSERLSSLSELEELIGSDDLSREDLAAILRDALHLELLRLRVEQDFDYQKRLLCLLRLWGDDEALPLIQAIAAEHPQSDVRDLAADVLSYRIDSVQSIWDNTPADQVSSVDERASRLNEILDAGLDERATIQAVFNQMKGALIKDAGDPRLSVLNELMIRSGERVRLACAFAIASSMTTR